MRLVDMTVGQMKSLFDSIQQEQSSFFQASGRLEILDLQEVVRLTGYTEKTIYSMINRRQIPFVKPEHGGRRVFFLRSEIIKWLTACRVETNEQAIQDHRLGICNGYRKKDRLVRRIFAEIQTLFSIRKQEESLTDLIWMTSAHRELEIKILKNTIAQYELQCQNSAL